MRLGSSEFGSLVPLSERATRANVTSRVIRPGQSPPPDDGWQRASVEERIAAVWELTKLCWAWRDESGDEHRLQRSVVRIQRPGDLIQDKGAAGRLQDLADVERLEAGPAAE